MLSTADGMTGLTPLVTAFGFRASSAATRVRVKGRVSGALCPIETEIGQGDPHRGRQRGRVGTLDFHAEPPRARQGPPGWRTNVILPCFPAPVSSMPG